MKTIVLLIAVVLVLCGPASATVVSYAGSSGPLAASAEFTLTGTSLTLTLTNTATAVPNDAGGVFTALFWDLTGDPILTPVGALIPAGSTVVNGGTTDIGAYWQYMAGMASSPASQGISAVGFGLFGPNGNFCSAENCGQKVDGVGYGIVPAGYVSGSGNGSILDQPLIRNSAVFNFTVPSGFELTAINHVTFQYGTALGEAHFPPDDDDGGGGGDEVPEPATFTLTGAVLIGVSVLVRKRLNRKPVR